MPMARTVRPVIFISLMLSACAFRPSRDLVYSVSLWHCSNASTFAVFYDGGAAVVSAAYKRYVLPPIHSESGARYAEGDVELRVDQGKATLLGADGGPYRDCVPGVR